MKRSSKVIITLVTLSLFTSCIRVETVVKVNKDGSGTITEKVMFSKAFADMMRSFGESFGGDTDGSKGFTIYDPDKLIKQAADYGDGVNYQSGKEVSEKDWEGYTAVYTFSDISKIKLNTDQNEKVDPGIGATEMNDKPVEEENEFYYFNFEKGRNAKLTINRKEIKESENDTSIVEMNEIDPDNEMDAMGKEMIKMFEGMKFNMSVIVDGKISQTNASYTDGSRITLLDVDFGEMMKNGDAIKQLSGNKPSNTADMKALMEKFEGLKVELEQPVVINFR